MSRLQLSTKLGKTLSPTEVNQLFDDIEAFVNTSKIPFDSFLKRFLRYRHISEPPEFLLYDFGVGANIGAIVDDGTWQETSLYVEFEPTYNNKLAIQVEVWYFTHYFTQPDVQIAISKRDSTTLVYATETNTAVNIGDDKTDPNTLGAFAPDLACPPGGGPQAHYYTGVGGWLPPSAGKAHGVCACATFGPVAQGGESTASGIDRYALAMNIPNASGDAIDDFDIALIFAYARDVD